MAAFCGMHGDRGVGRKGRAAVDERGGQDADGVGGMWRKLGEIPAGALNPELSLALLGAITVFLGLVAQAWWLLVLWAEGRATRPAGAKSTGPAGNEKER